MDNQQQKKDENDEKIRIADHVIGVREIHGVFQEGPHKFKFRFPTPAERAKIETQISRLIGGVPVESYNANEYATVRMTTYLDNVLVETPEWWTGAANCFDEQLTYRVWSKFVKDMENFRGRLREGKFPRFGPGGPA